MPPDEIEVAPVVEKPAPAVDPALAEKEAVKAQQIRERGVAIKKQRTEELAKARADAATALARAEAAEKRAEEQGAWKKKALADPEALKDIYGENWFEALTRARLGDDANLQVHKTEQTLRAELDAVRTELRDAFKKRDDDVAAEKTATQKAQEQQDAEDVREYSESVTAFVRANAAEYESINALGLGHLVAARAKSIFDKTGKLPSAAGAAADLEKEVDALLEKTIALPKWQKKLGGKPAFDFGGTRKEKLKLSIGTTLTPSTPPAAKTKPLTRDQRREKAIAALK